MAIFTTLMLLVINLILSLSQIKSGNWYYFDNYKATKGFSAPFGFQTEFLDRSQADYKTSVQNLNGQQYYFDPKTGIMVTNRYVSDDKG